MLIRHLKRRFVCVAMMASATNVFACGSATKTARQPLDGDRDNDSHGITRYDWDNDAVPSFGQPAGAVDRGAIAGLIGRYYEAAKRSDGTTTCTLMYGLTAEAVVEQYGGQDGSPALRGANCERIATSIFNKRHKELATDVAKLRVGVVRVQGNRGLAIVHFGDMLERRVLLHRERGSGAWRMGVLLDDGAP